MDLKGNNGTVPRATLASICCHFCWGLSFLASRTALNEAHVFVLLSHRFLISFLLLHLLPSARFYPGSIIMEMKAAIKGFCAKT